MEDINQILKRSKDYQEGVMTGREMAVKQYDKILIKIHDDLQIVKIAVENLTKHNKDFKKPCPRCEGRKSEIDYDNGVPMPHRYCSICKGQGFIKS